MTGSVIFLPILSLSSELKECYEGGDAFPASLKISPTSPVRYFFAMRQVISHLKASIGGRTWVLGRSGVFIDLPHRLSSLGSTPNRPIRLYTMERG